MKTKMLWPVAVGLLVLGLSAWYWRLTSRGHETGGAPRMQSVRIGTIFGDISAPLFLAQELGYFSKQNLKVDLVLYPTGSEATAALLEERLDFSAAAEYVFVLNAFKNPDLRVLGVIGTGQLTEIVARTDNGIARPEDLRGKRIGVPRGTHAEYFLGRFLAVHGLVPKEVEVIDTRPAEQGRALEGGAVDAVVAWEPYLSEVRRDVTKELVTWGLRDHDFYWLLLSREEVLDKGDVQDRVIRALMEADDFIETDPRESRRVVSKFTGSKEQSPRSWENFYFDFGLPQPLLSVMEEEARWAIENGLTKADRVPNYLEFLDLGSLKRINERAITVIQ